jgi:DNA-nicking Smr family endonuclease
MKSPTLDLHGIRHEEVPDVLAKFLWRHRCYKDALVIITGYSHIMKNRVQEVLVLYNTRRIEESDGKNHGRMRVWLAN